MEEILTKIDWKILQEYIDKKLIIINKHPQYDIWILNYSKETQFSKSWDLMTSTCRGLVIDIEGNILARCMKKFKNYEEYDPAEIDWSKEFDVFEKMDGSLIILFYYELVSKWIVASRGSFTSEQALEAQKMLNVSALDNLNKYITYLFEILYPENRIVVNYGKRRELVLLTAIITEDGVELTYDTIEKMYSKYFTVVKKLELKSFDELRKLINTGEDNKEGVVLRFTNGFRLKMKFAEYCRLHTIVTNVSNLTVWEHLKNNNDFEELLDRVPDEFNNWLKKTIDILKKEFNEIECQALTNFAEIHSSDRKSFAIEAMKFKKYTSILFKLHDKKPYDQLIWKMIRPVFSKPFKDGFDDDL
jgi:RNA ligase